MILDQDELVDDFKFNDKSEDYIKKELNKYLKILRGKKIILEEEESKDDEDQEEYKSAVRVREMVFEEK